MDNIVTDVRSLVIKQKDLIIALELAISSQESKERVLGRTIDSTLLKGWRRNLDELRKGTLIQIVV